MPHIVEAEIPAVVLVPPGTTPNYNKENPIWRLVERIEAVNLAAGREYYVADSIQYLFPIDRVALYGPGGDAWEVRDPRNQENKNDFQKQNIHDYRLTGVEIARGYVHVDGWTGAFLHLSCTPVDGSPLLDADGSYPGEALTLWLRTDDTGAGELLRVPYDPVGHRFAIEIWADPGRDIRQHLDPTKGQPAVDRGAIVVRPSLVRGTLDVFQGPAFDQVRDEAKTRGAGVEMIDYAVGHTCHPTRPLRLELAWATEDRQRWDSLNGQNYRYEFCMSFRGWRNYLAVGQSENPHGGVGTLEYRNLYSNYFGHEAKRRAAFGGTTLPELGRDLEPWNVDADGVKPPQRPREPFMAVDYMDLHVVKPGAAIGIHRHRDNQELFSLIAGKGYMVTADWALHDGRGRAFEIRTMRPGDMALIKGGQMHALLNALDENMELLMFGGYD